MCKDMPVIPANRAVDKKRIIGKMGGHEEEVRHKVSLTEKNVEINDTYFNDKL
jgi:hypothetical protein